MGLRHRAALGSSEASDAISVVVSEQTGAISIAHNGRMIRRLDSERLENILLAFYQPSEIALKVNLRTRVSRWIDSIRRPEE
jgi:diadenylate cyclase